MNTADIRAALAGSGADRYSAEAGRVRQEYMVNGRQTTPVGAYVLQPAAAVGTALLAHYKFGTRGWMTFLAFVGGGLGGYILGRVLYPEAYAAAEARLNAR